MKRVLSLAVFLILSLFTHLVPTHAKDLDSTDNKSPSLVSVSLNKNALVEGEIALVTVVIRDDKNELTSWPIVLFGAPADSPGSVSGGVFSGSGRGLVNTLITSQFVEQTFEFELKAPSWPGNYYGFNIQGVRDKNGNAVGFDLKRCDNKNIYISPQAMSFPELVPTCNTSFNVRLLTEAEKTQAKAAAELKTKQEAEAKTAAELKAKQEAEAKAAAEAKAKAEAEAKTKAEAEAKAAAELKAKQEAEAKAAAELKAKQEAEAKAKAEAAKKKITITCVKGNLTKKVTAVKPKCPNGYKKK